MSFIGSFVGKSYQTSSGLLHSTIMPPINVDDVVYPLSSVYNLALDIHPKALIVIKNPVIASLWRNLQIQLSGLVRKTLEHYRLARSFEILMEKGTAHAASRKKKSLTTKRLKIEWSHLVSGKETPLNGINLTGRMGQRMTWYPEKGLMFYNKQGQVTAWCPATEAEDCDIVMIGRSDSNLES